MVGRHSILKQWNLPCLIDSHYLKSVGRLLLICVCVYSSQLIHYSVDDRNNICVLRLFFHCHSMVNSGHLASYAKMWVAHAPGMPGTFSPPQRVSDPDLHHGTCVTHVSWCMPGSLTSVSFEVGGGGKRSRHSQRMRNPQFTYLARGPLFVVRALASGIHGILIPLLCDIYAYQIHPSHCLQWELRYLWISVAIKVYRFGYFIHHPDEMDIL